MHEEILTKEQLEIFPHLSVFSRNFGLVGGTAIALHLGHRKSIDFDLFSFKEFKNERILTLLRKGLKIQKTLVNHSGELTILIQGVKLTFYNYHFDIKYSKNVNGILKIPDLITLAAMKAFALGGRAKWKDYVDLYFIFQKHSFAEVASKASEIFGGEFNEKLLREQLSYFKDVDAYQQEVVEYMPGFEVSEEIIKKNLANISLTK